MIVGITINNFLLFPAGEASANRLNGAETLPMPEDSLATAFAMLIENAESGWAPKSTGAGIKTAVLNCDSDKEQPNLALLGFVAANCFLMGGRTEIPTQNMEAEETSTLSAGKADSASGVHPVMNTICSPVDTESVPISGLSLQAETEQAQSFGRVGAVEFRSIKKNSETNAEQAIKSTQNERLAARPEGELFKADPKPASERVMNTPVKAQPDALKNMFAFEPVSTVTAENAQHVQAQDSAFQSDLKAIRTELDLKTGFRLNSSIGKTAAESIKSANTLLKAGTAAREQVQTAAKTQPHAILEPEVLPDAADANRESDAETVLSLDIGEKNLKAGSVQTEPDKFEAQLKEKSGVGTEKVQDLNAAAQSGASVHSSSAAEAAKTQPKPADSVVLQLEAPIKKEAAKGTDTSFKIKLKPEGLGEVTVDLRHVAGKLEVTIKTELSSTKELISENIQTLRNALSADDGSKTLSLASLTVEQDERQFGAFSQSGFHEERHSPQSGGNSFGFRASAEQSKGSRTVRYRTGLIDYTV